ncbi:MAG: hypothetical protein J6M60_03535 [Clostridia bacterium]|nr:hypothetical protein [Clostridia bacterium]
MTSSDIVEMYKKGYSINYIVNQWYKWKTKNDEKNYRSGRNFVVTKKSIKVGQAKKEVEEIILKNSPISNKAN